MPTESGSIGVERPISNGQSRLEFRHHPIAVVAMALALVAVLAATAWRIERNYSPPGTEFDWSRRGFSDFHNGTYFPSRAYLDGASPYSSQTATEYSMARAAPPYSPVVFILHLPFALMPLAIARVAFFLFNAGLMLVIAWMTLWMSGQRFRWFDFLAFANLLLLSRPGHVTMFTGYFTAEIVIGCVIALHYGHTRPAVSGMGLVLASIKPNFVIPLAIMMLFRRNWRAVILGFAFSVVAAVAGLGWLAWHNGWSQTIADFRGGQTELHDDPTELPVNTWTRTDLLGMVAKVTNWAPDDKVYLAAMLVMLMVVGMFVWKASQTELNPGATGLTAFISAIAVLVGMYHHAYDCLLVAVPAVGAIFYGGQTLAEVDRRLSLAAGLLCAIPAANYLSTKSLMDGLGLEQLGFWWQATTMINGVCLLLALLLLVATVRQNR